MAQFDLRAFDDNVEIREGDVFWVAPASDVAQWLLKSDEWIVTIVARVVYGLLLDVRIFHSRVQHQFKVLVFTLDFVPFYCLGIICIRGGLDEFVWWTPCVIVCVFVEKANVFKKKPRF